MRLSEDDGPPAHLFLEDDEELEDEVGDDDMSNIRGNASHAPPSVELQTVAIRRDEVTGHEAVPPAPPPKD